MSLEANTVEISLEFRGVKFTRELTMAEIRACPDWDLKIKTEFGQLMRESRADVVGLLGVSG